MVNTNAQNLNSSKNSYGKRRIIDNKKFHFQYDELAIEKTIDEVWKGEDGKTYLGCYFTYRAKFGLLTRLIEWKLEAYLVL